jgi:hypothetical protein
MQCTWISSGGAKGGKRKGWKYVTTWNELILQIFNAADDGTTQLTVREARILGRKIHTGLEFTSDPLVLLHFDATDPPFCGGLEELGGMSGTGFQKVFLLEETEKTKAQELSKSEEIVCTKLKENGGKMSLEDVFAFLHAMEDRDAAEECRSLLNPRHHDDFHHALWALECVYERKQ